LIWHLWDWYLRPGGGYFGTKKACEPLHVQLSVGQSARRAAAANTTDDHAVLVVSELWQPQTALEVRARLFDLAGRELWAENRTVDVGADAVVHALELPALERRTAFLRLELRRGAELVSSNFYWLSSRPDRLDHEKGNWYVTPQLEFADFSELATLPPAKLSARVRVAARSTEQITLAVDLQNGSSALAFFTRLRVLEREREVLPVFWSDNFVSLLAGESLSIEVSVPRAELVDESALELELSGWNCERSRFPCR
jgi:exo-1,4-beta-D-glucosaminidase